ncbi:MAG: hypothetical protein WCO52_04115 [bacterium]
MRILIGFFLVAVAVISLCATAMDELAFSAQTTNWVRVTEFLQNPSGVTLVAVLGLFLLFSKVWSSYLRLAERVREQHEQNRLDIERMDADLSRLYSEVRQGGADIVRAPSQSPVVRKPGELFIVDGQDGIELHEATVRTFFAPANPQPAS